MSSADDLGLDTAYRVQFSSWKALSIDSAVSSFARHMQSGKIHTRFPRGARCNNENGRNWIKFIPFFSRRGNRVSAADNGHNGNGELGWEMRHENRFTFLTLFGTQLKAKVFRLFTPSDPHLTHVSFSIPSVRFAYNNKRAGYVSVSLLICDGHKIQYCATSFGRTHTWRPLPDNKRKGFVLFWSDPLLTQHYSNARNGIDDDGGVCVAIDRNGIRQPGAWTGHVLCIQTI